jgi:hypothetical protein
MIRLPSKEIELLGDWKHPSCGLILVNRVLGPGPAYGPSDLNGVSNLEGDSAESCRG